jgi:tRNA G37 N-methylase Trm5
LYTEQNKDKFYQNHIPTSVESQRYLQREYSIIGYVAFLEICVVRHKAKNGKIKQGSQKLSA